MVTSLIDYRFPGKGAKGRCVEWPHRQRRPAAPSPRLRLPLARHGRRARGGARAARRALAGVRARASASKGNVPTFILITLNGLTLAGPVLHQRQRPDPDLRAAPGDQPGPRRAVPARRLRGAHARSGRRPVVGAGRAARDGGQRRRRPGHASAVPALEPGPGPAAGADHHRGVADPRRPDAGPLRRARRPRSCRPTSWRSRCRSASTTSPTRRFRIAILGRRDPRRPALLAGLSSGPGSGMVVRAGVDDTRDDLGARGQRAAGLRRRPSSSARRWPVSAASSPAPRCRWRPGRTSRSSSAPSSSSSSAAWAASAAPRWAPCCSAWSTSTPAPTCRPAYSNLSALLTFVLLAVILAVRPTGLFGKAR